MSRRPKRIDPATDPIPDDLTPAERAAVVRQGEVLADQRAEGVPLLGDQGARRGADYDYG